MTSTMKRALGPRPRGRAVRRGALISLLAGLALPPITASLAEPAPAPPPPPATWRLERGEDVCTMGCLGYSPSQKVWLCGVQDGGRSMTVQSTHCRLRLLRDRDWTILAEVLVYAGDSWGVEHPEQALPLDWALKIAPPDLLPVVDHELVDRQVIAIPRTRHSLKLELAPLRLMNKPADNTGTRLTALCDHQPTAAEMHPAPPLLPRRLPLRAAPAAPQPAARPRSALVFRFHAEQCGQKESYHVQFGPDPQRFVIIQHMWYGCVDYSRSSTRAYPIDLTEACGAP